MNEQSNTHKFLKTSEACKHFNVAPNTIRKWADEGLIKVVRSDPTQNGFGHRRYDISSFKNQIVQDISQGKEIKKNEFDGRICYCRVSSKHQADDLTRQIEFMQNKYPNYEIIKDIGSGINFQRPGLLRIINRAIEGNVKEVVVAYKDRLCRFGFELLECVFTKCNVKLVVLNNELPKSAEQELSEDLLSIVHVFSCRSNGRRKYKARKLPIQIEAQQEKGEQENKL